MTTSFNARTEPAFNMVRLWGRVDAPSSTALFVAVRISDSDARADLKKLLDALRHQAAGSQIAVALESLGKDVTEDSPEGERDRTAAGLVPVRLRDLDPGAPDRLLAYAGMVCGVLVALIPSTAIESDLPPFPGDRTRAPRNGATEILLEAIECLPCLGMLAVPRLDRLCRRVAFQGLLLDKLRQADVLLSTDSGVRDLVDQAQMALTSLEGTTKGDGDAISMKQKMLGGRIGALTVDDDGYSKRDFHYTACPPGYGPLWQDSPDGGRAPVKGSIVVVPGHAPAIKVAWEMFAAGKCLRAIGDAVAALGWPMRDRSARTLADVSSKKRATAMGHALTRDLAELHQSGAWRKERSTNAPMHTAGGHDLVRHDDGRHGIAIIGRLPVHLVEGLPWGVALGVWVQVMSRFERDRSETPKGWGARRSKGLMASSPMFWADGAWHRWVKATKALQLRSIAGGSEHEPVEWDMNLSTLEASSGFNRALRALGVELLAKLALAGAGAQELTMAPGTETDMVRTLHEDLRAARSLSAEAAAAAKDAGALAGMAQRGGNLQAAAAQLATQEACLAKACQAGARVSALEGELAAASAGGLAGQASLRTPLGVGAALSRWDGKEDPVLGAALEQLGIVATMRGRYDPATGEIHVVAQATIHLTDGAEVRLPLAVTLLNTSNYRERGTGAPALVVAWAAGATLEELAVRHGRAPRWVRQTISGWFARHGVDEMVPALLDCPVLVTRVAVVATLAPQLARMPSRTSAGAKLAPATIALLVAPYVNDRGGRWQAWTVMKHDSMRRVVAVLRVAGGEADVAALRVAAGTEPTDLARPHRGRPALLTAPRPARRRLRACPHPDCPNPWASHVLIVPETAAYGLLCPVCLRLPDVAYADAPLPAEYGAKWELGKAGAFLVTTRSSAAALRLPDVGLARIAGELIRSRQVAPILGLTPHAIGPLRAAGRLPTVVQCGTVSLWRRPQVEALALLRAGSSRQATKDGMLSPAEAAKRLGVADDHVRRYCQEGILAYTTEGRHKGARIRIRPEAVAAFAPPAGDLIAALTVEEVTRRTGLTRPVIAAAMGSGDLVSVAPSWGPRRVLPDALAAWLSQRPRLPRGTAHAPRGGVGVKHETRGRLSVSAAAAMLQLSAKQVRRLADQGVLNAHHGDDSSWRWFDAVEVAALAAKWRQ